MFKKTLKEWKPSESAWHGAAAGVILAAILIFLASTFDLIQNSVSFGDASIYFFGGLALTALIGALLAFFWVAITNIPAIYKWSFACFAFVIYYIFIPPQATWEMAFIALWALVSFSLAGGALWILLREKGSSKFKAIISLFIGLVGIAILIFWLFAKNALYQPPDIPEDNTNIPLITLADPGLPGSFVYSTLTYGSGTNSHRPEFDSEAALVTKTVNGNDFLEGWDGLEGWLRSRYWGFDSTHLPLNGRVWYPEGDGPFPLVLIAHGNHEMSAPSDQGYDYLGTLFASHGFITVSIDENFLNSSWVDLWAGINETAARGWLILEHLALWRHLNKTENNLFYKKVDIEKIALIGHSRGGEAIATAAAFNVLDHYPGNGNIKFNYFFNIRGLAALSPVDAQYMPAGLKIELNNVDYLVIHGSHDGDVRSFEGEAQYHRVHFTDSHYHFKAALYVYGANHGQFNSLWGKNDAGFPVTTLFDLGKIMPAAQQQQIAKVYLSAFLEVTLNEKKGYLPLFHNYRTGKEWLPQTLYLNQFDDSTYQYVIKETKEIDMTKINLAGGKAEGKNLEVWRQNPVLLKDGTLIGTFTYLGWGTSHRNFPTYIISLPEKGLKINSQSILMLTLADAEKRDMGTRPSPIDFTIALTDNQGQNVQLPLSDYAYLQPTLNINLMKASFLESLPNSENNFETFEFPLSHFLAKNPSFDPSGLTKISLIFDRSPKGLIILDNLAIKN